MRKSIGLICVVITVLLLGCSSTVLDPYVDTTCDQVTLIDASKYMNASSAIYTIKEINVNGDCLEISIVSSGCDGNSWKAELIDSEGIMESLIVQRELRLVLENLEICDAIITKTFTFDLRPIQINDDKVILNVKFWDEQVLYEY